MLGADKEKNGMKAQLTLCGYFRVIEPIAAGLKGLSLAVDETKF